MARGAASFRNARGEVFYALQSVADGGGRLRKDLHDIAERAVEPAADAHKDLKRDGFVFGELGQRIRTDADLAGKLCFVPAPVAEELEEIVLATVHGGAS